MEPCHAESTEGADSTGEVEPTEGVLPPHSHRKRPVRAESISIKRLSKRALAQGAMLYPEQPGVDYERPQTRAACESSERPCPFVSCKHHLYLDVSERTGSIKLNFPDLEVWEMPETCALDLADDGERTLEQIGDTLNITREAVRLIVDRGLAKIKVASAHLMDDGRVHLSVVRP